MFRLLKIQRSSRSIFTARIQKMLEGNSFSLFVSSQPMGICSIPIILPTTGPMSFLENTPVTGPRSTPVPGGGWYLAINKIPIPSFLAKTGVPPTLSSRIGYAWTDYVAGGRSLAGELSCSIYFKCFCDLCVTRMAHLRSKDLLVSFLTCPSVVTTFQR